MARRRQYSNTKGKRAALRHIEEAREFTEEIGGSDLDVKKYFFSLSDIELAPILSEYGEDFGSKAEDYARETLPKWKSGNREMSGIVCKRLFGLLPPRMPLKKKYELAENIWKHFGPSSDNSYQIGPNTPISSVEKLIFSKLVEVVTEYSIPENVHNRFSWLSDGDVKAKEDLLNYFRQLEKTLLSEKINSELPILEELIKIIKDIKNFKPDLILAVGGGAVIDYAKIANVVDVRSDLADLIVNYSYPFKEKYTKLAVIPTTAGSGAEVTSNAVIYVDGIKHSFESELLIPDNFFLIPEFLISAPNKIKASAGFDAIAQALESLVSKKSNDQSVEYASNSLRVSINSYVSFLNEPNLKNATEMSIASNLAGKAISISKTTAPHAASYPFTSLFNISHGHAVGLFFESFFKFNFDNLNRSETSFDLKKRFDLIFDLFGVKSINDFNSKITLIKQQAKLEDNLETLDIDIRQSSEKIIKGINLLRLGNNPVKIDGKDIFNIISRNI